MRNKTFISSMVLSVVCVSAANAGVVDPFTNAETAFAQNIVPTVAPINVTGGLFNQRNVYRANGGSGSVSGGFVNFVPRSFWMVYRQTTGTIDLSGITSMSFDITASGTFEVQWVITDSTGIAIDHEIGVVSGSTTVTFNSFIGTGENLGFNMASIQMMEVKFVDGSAGSTGQISNFNYTGVPAPGALALLGVAGLVGARRRRA